jgi:hypothetical protein
MTVTTIKSFKEIPIQRNTLVLCDIDDTVIVFEKLGKKWWIERFDDYYARNCDFEFSEEAVLKEWIHTIRTMRPVHVDKNGFEDFVERIEKTGSTLVFVTARSQDISDLTTLHLNSAGIYPKTDVHHTNNTPKGDYIATVIDFDDFENVVFIDDMEHNIESVHQVFGEKVELFLFNS